MFKKNKIMQLWLLSLATVSVAVQAENKEETVVVTASTSQEPTAPVKGIVATKTLSATKTSADIVKTPQSVSVITRDQMEQLDVTSVSQALRYSAGVFTEYRGSSNRNDEVFVRGFSYVPKFLDGLSYGATASSQTGTVDPWLLERVELVRGPASVLFGQVNPGGLISMTSKRPTSEPIHNVQFRTGNHDLAEGAFDFGGPLSDDGRVLYRVNGIARTQHNQVEDYKETRMAIAPAITWYPNDQTRFTLLTSYQKDPDAGYRNFLPAYGTVTSANGRYIPRDFNVSDPDYNQSWREQTMIGYELEHQFDDNLTFRQNARYASIKQKYRYLVYANSAADSTVLTRRAQHEERTTNEFGLDNQLESLFATGEVNHTLLGGLDYKTSKDKQLLERGMGTQYDLDWTKPVYGINVDESTFSKATDEQQNFDQMGVYLQDQLSWNNWEWLVSGRYDWAEVRTTDFTGSAPTQQNDNKFTWRTGLLYAFDFGLSPYISYSTSFEPSLQTNRAPGVAPFKPTTGKQTEIGLKYQPVDSTLMTLALYDLTQSNVATYNSAQGWFENAGEVRSKGVEAEIHSTLMESINLIGSYTYTDAETQSTTVAGTEGKTPARIPAHMASAFASYTVPSGALKSLTAGVGMRYIGTSYGDAKNTFKVASVDLYDAMMSYELGELSSSLKGASVQFNVNNVADTKYVASCASDTACFYGIGRTVTATVNYRW
ncbi:MULTISPECIES: TonB-dependent siderophore receptor [Lelliottia]|uniref:TonB-dependent siderophore receptor n=1 Tax=Lelliottia aquatilis TaxID=2080838 RepID=A0ABX5A146_9ENTR|nr:MULTISPECIES: TonB-dependent siderophore receptor [Lelliottia]NTZ46173.1 TonB-dependent siderophore receptor [Lelliottia aquatilis]POZ22787.1 TonB-dependent siderophore receptor [Lelliottia aquatilis]POZ25423.1 TonB-dependent siderophore receptor [Lelliottia sp. 7254-16]POZ26362.1 TonB-dependent siderophore receptor [Lelliottia aquatilis]POZ32350.1 TonB-dependent siderophore receptor [Lelliottia aquatilis]